MMLDHIKLGADFSTTCLTTFRTGLPGDSSTRRTLYQFFRTKKHVLDAVSRKKLHPFAWVGRGRWFKFSHSDQIKPLGNSPTALFLFKCLYWNQLSETTPCACGAEGGRGSPKHAQARFGGHGCGRRFKSISGRHGVPKPPCAVWGSRYPSSEGVVRRFAFAGIQPRIGLSLPPADEALLTNL